MQVVTFVHYLPDRAEGMSHDPEVLLPTNSSYWYIIVRYSSPNVSTAELVQPTTCSAIPINQIPIEKYEDFMHFRAVFIIRLNRRTPTTPFGRTMLPSLNTLCLDESVHTSSGLDWFIITLGTPRVLFPTPTDIHGNDSQVLLMGQSNMSGFGEGYDDALDGPNDPRIKQWTRANTIITASERLEHADYDHFSSFQNSRVGMGTAFGRAYVQNLPSQRNVLLVPTAFGGTNLVGGPWSVGGRLFEDAVTRMEAALASDESGGNCVAAILWHQGEKDASKGVDQDSYESSWTSMIENLRFRIPAAAEAPVILGEFTDKQMETSPDNFESILAAIRAIPAAVSWTAVASSDGLESNAGSDIVHFSAAALREYGQRYFDALVLAIENE